MNNHRHGPAGARPANCNRPALVYDRGNLEAVREAMPTARRCADAVKLAALFNTAARVPELRKALDWARKQGIEFVIDHKTGVSGYYTPGSGVVALSARLFEKDARGRTVVTAEAVATAVHEIRHAWQESQGLLPSAASSFAGLVLRLSLTEADATAHEKLALRQFRATFTAQAGPRDARREEQLELWGYFKDWYKTEAPYYNGLTQSLFAKAYGLDAAGLPDYSDAEGEFTFGHRVRTRGVDVDRFEQVRKLGRGFNDGANYFDVAERDILFREFLSAGRAAALFGDGAPPPLACAIRRIELQHRRARRQHPA